MKGLMLLLALVLAPPALADDQAIRVAASEVIEAAGEARLVVLGEIHGTRQVPLLVGRLAEHYAAQGPLVLALEMERTEHEALASYLQSDGAASASDTLRQRPYWNIADSSNDGRRSIDMLDLIETMRTLRASGRDVAIAPYDIARGYTGSERERSMASHIRSAYRSLPSGRMLVLTGNVHALLQPRTFPSLGRTIEPMTWHLRKLQPYSIRISASAGEIWGCRARHDCGSLPFLDHGRSGPSDAAPVHHHYYVVMPVFSLARLPGEGRDLSP